VAKAALPANTPTQRPGSASTRFPPLHYTTAADLVARTSRRRPGTLGEHDAVLAGPQVLIVDELGYLPMVAEAGSHLFQVITRRHLRGTVILTTNRGIAEWGHIFEDTTVAVAILDRLLHHAIVMQINSDSYRMRGHRARLQQLRGGSAVKRRTAMICVDGSRTLYNC
jgi:DNA replication protein DnaC